jgi:membrane-bound lytic murein transglycosylase MltF
MKVNVITPNHFEKMNTSLSVALLSHDVAAAILYQNSVKNIEAKHQTTAWFLMLMQKWLKLMTSRSQNMAMSNANPKEHDAAIRFFHTLIQIVTTLKTNDNVWKPFQAGLLLSTLAALDHQNIYLVGAAGPIWFMTPAPLSISLPTIT